MSVVVVEFSYEFVAQPLDPSFHSCAGGGSGADRIRGNFPANASYRQDDRDAIVLSETVWDQYFARSPDLVGRCVLSADRQVLFTVVGVVADRFQFPNARTHAWVPALT